jgi:hypothetical protein
MFETKHGTVIIEYVQLKGDDDEFELGVRTGSDFSCPKGTILGNFGHVDILTIDEYEASEWANYGVHWKKGHVAVPSIPKTNAETKLFAPFVNTASKRQKNNCRFTRPRRGNPTINLVSTRAIKGKETLLVTYGAMFTRRLRK